MDKRYEAMYQRGHQQEASEPVAREEHTSVRQPDPEPGPVEVAPVTPAGERVSNDPPAPPSSPRANPFIWLLIIVGSILTVGAGVALFAGGQLINMQMSAGSFGAQQEAFLLMTYGQALTTLAPFLLALGLGTLIGVVFLKAHAWQRSHAHDLYRQRDNK